MVLFDYLSILWRYSPRKTLVFFALLVASSITESMGLLLLIPLLSVLQETAQVGEGAATFILKGLQAVGLPITLPGILAAFLAITLVRVCVQYTHTTVSEKLRLELMDSLRANAFDAILNAKWTWISSVKKSDLSNLLITEINRIGTGVNAAIRGLVSGVMICAYVLVALSLSTWLTLIAITLGLVLMIVLWSQHKHALVQGQLRTDANKQVQQVIEDGLSGLKLTKILSNETRHSQLMGDIRALLRKRTLAFTKINAASELAFQLLSAIFLTAFLYLGVEVLDLPVATLLVLVLVFARLAPQIRNLQTQINFILNSKPALENYHHILNEALSKDETAKAKRNIQPFDFNDSIHLANINFQYQTRHAETLENVTLTIPHNKTTAIMGASGSGKSTLADLIMGLISPDSGSVAIDGRDLNAENRLLWRRSVAYVSQDVFLFHGSIRNNLLWAKASATQEQLTEALKKASAEFVFDLPDQMDTIVGDAGQRLSGGERQRIALARALLQSPLLLILDEATSALDMDNETRIRQTIDQLHGDLTVIVIGHRLPTLKNSDQLVVLDNARVKAVGTWDEVISQGQDLE